jgi:hypothetical protein
LKYLTNPVKGVIIHVMSNGKEKLQLSRAETLPAQHGEWLGGIFEAAGGMGFLAYLRKGKIYTYPYLHLVDNDLSRIELFKDMLGDGRLIGLKGNSCEWRLEGKRAVMVASAFGDYAPSRSGVIDAFKEWEVSSSQKDREIIAGRIRATERTAVIKEDYSGLIKNPKFLAGTLDARGSVYVHANGNTLTFSAASMNRQLLEALAGNYGGYVAEIARESANGTHVRTEWRTSDKGIIQNIYKHAEGHIKFTNKIHTIA